MLSVVKAIKALIKQMEKNSLSVGVISFGEAVVEKITAATGKDLLINPATGKDVKINLTDAAGARKVIIYDSGETAVVEIDSDGEIKAVSFTGAVIGDVTGNLTGDVIGDVTGNLTGDVIGDVTGNLTGDLAVYAEAETTGAPTQADLVTEFEAANTHEPGIVGVFDDSAGESYIVATDGTSYQIATMAEASAGT
ncbi:MAG: hypothetical protein QM396_00760 [Euryarchaeota archaeon]|nr:hypothetical protein [Euryarchaeota archaeon]